MEARFLWPWCGRASILACFRVATCCPKQTEMDTPFKYTCPPRAESAPPPRRHSTLCWKPCRIHKMTSEFATVFRSTTSDGNWFLVSINSRHAKSSSPEPLDRSGGPGGGRGWAQIIETQLHANQRREPSVTLGSKHPAEPQCRVKVSLTRSFPQLTGKPSDAVLIGFRLKQTCNAARSRLRRVRLRKRQAFPPPPPPPHRGRIWQ